MPKVKHPQLEEEHHRLAFEQYYALGAGRSCQQLARKLGVSLSTVKLWCRRFGWRQRVAERDGAAARQVADHSAQTAQSDRARDLKICHMAKMKLTKDIAEGKIKGKIPDLEMLIRLQDYLLGSHADSIVALIRQLPPEVQDRIRNILMKHLSPPVAPPDHRPESAGG